MKILYVYAHPNAVSLNNTLKQHALDFLSTLNASVTLSDLYANHFKATADWNDFNTTNIDVHLQYFLAQQSAYNNHQLTSDITEEIDKIASVDHIILQFPLWWFSTPAILKGWLDRVLVKGFAYDSGKVFDEGLLKGKTASLVVTTQSPKSAYQIDGMHGATIDTFLHHIHHTLHFVGIKTLSPFVIYSAFNLDSTEQAAITKQYRDYLNLTLAS